MSGVVAVSDTMLGYGSSQVLSLTQSLAELIGSGHTIFQPFLPHRKFVDLSKHGYCVETVTTVEHPWSWVGRMQYLRRVAKIINEHRPEVLVVPNYNMIPIIGLLDFRPRKIIHLALEDLDQFGLSFWAQYIVRKIKNYVSHIDIWVFPETNRAAYDCSVLNIPYDRICILYNVATDVQLTLGASERNGSVVYAGSVDFDRTAAHFFSRPDFSGNALDVYGGLSGSDLQKKEFLAATRIPRNRIRYFGEVPAEVLANRLRTYAYSLVYWLPLNQALRNAAPNKFFQAIASGVPVITAPHPQCALLIQRYGCGIVLKDWEFNTLVSGFKSAIDKIGTPAYQEMVKGCQEAYVNELNWQNQFKKLEILFAQNTR